MAIRIRPSTGKLPGKHEVATWTFIDPHSNWSHVEYGYFSAAGFAAQRSYRNHFKTNFGVLYVNSK